MFKKRVDTPIYVQIVDLLKEEIAQLNANDPILSERLLEKKFKASRMTVRKAIDVLVEEGVLYRVQNIGTFVADQKLHKNYESPAMKYFNCMSEFKILYFDSKVNDERIIQELEIPFDERYIRIVRLNLENLQPVSIDEIYIVSKMLEINDLGDINEIFRFSASIENTTVKQKFIPINVPVKYARLLNMKIETPIIRVDSKLSTREGNVYAFIETYSNPEKIILEFTI